LIVIAGIMVGSSSGAFIAFGIAGALTFFSAAFGTAGSGL